MDLLSLGTFSTPNSRSDRTALQRHLESNSFAKREFGKLSGAGQGVARAAGGRGLADYGVAPEFRGIARWLNTPGGRTLTMRQLHGKVVLIDFWTYSCINCLRTLPHLEAWYSTYHSKGFTIVGVHTPEFSFEHVASNVRRAVEQLGVRYPVPLDNDYGTWDAYHNQYWPAEYLIDRRGHVRHAHFGEGEYDRTERLIRTLLAESTSKLPVASRLSTPRLRRRRRRRATSGSTGSSAMQAPRSYRAGPLSIGSRTACQ